MTYLTPFTPYSPPRRGDISPPHPLPYGGEVMSQAAGETILPPEKGVRLALQVEFDLRASLEEKQCPVITDVPRYRRSIAPLARPTATRVGSDLSKVEMSAAFMVGQRNK